MSQAIIASLRAELEGKRRDIAAEKRRRAKSDAPAEIGTLRELREEEEFIADRLALEEEKQRQADEAERAKAQLEAMARERERKELGIDDLVRRAERRTSLLLELRRAFISDMQALATVGDELGLDGHLRAAYMQRMQQGWLAAWPEHLPLPAGFGRFRESFLERLPDMERTILTERVFPPSAAEAQE